MIDESSYKSVLCFDRGGVKLNPVQMKNFESADAEAIGHYLIKLYKEWQPNKDHNDNQKIGELYGFDLYIRRQKETYEEKGLFEYRYSNVFYAESKETNIKYTWNGGHINIDNPKLSARYFLNAIDRVEALKDKYEKNLAELDRNIPVLKQIILKPFDKEGELAQLKTDVARLEREITIKIQTNQMLQQGSEVNNTLGVKEGNIKELLNGKNEKVLLPKKVVIDGKHKGIKL
jgi:hypothetical protein